MARAPSCSAPWWSEKETATWLGVHYLTMIEWHREGVGPPRVHEGKRVYYRPSDVQAWLGHQRPQGEG